MAEQEWLVGDEADLPEHQAELRDKLYGYLTFHLSQQEIEGVEPDDPKVQELFQRLSALFATGVATTQLEPGTRRYPIVRAYTEHAMDIINDVIGDTLKNLDIKLMDPADLDKLRGVDGILPSQRRKDGPA